MPRCRRVSPRFLPAVLAAAALPLGAPAAALATSTPHHRPDPIAHIALGISRTLKHTRHHGPVAHIALGVMHTNLTRARRHRRRHTRGHAASAPCANATTPAVSASVSAMRTAVVCLVNQERASRGLPPLNEAARLNASAQSWTNTMVRTGQFTHGTDFAGRISDTGYDWSTAGENIATGFTTPRSVVDAWMASPGHCRNILNPSFADIGVGLNLHTVGGGTFGQATWTQDFGLWMGHSAPSTNTGPMNSCGSGA